MNDHPVLLLPVRLETRFKDDNLWVRIHPDQIFVDTHEKRLTEIELDAGQRYIKVINSSLEDKRQETQRDAWRKLSRQFGPERAAWIAKTVANLKDPHSLDLRKEQEGWLVVPTLMALPDHFVVFAYRNGKPVGKPVPGKRIRNGLSLLGAPSTSQGELFDAKSNWMVDLTQAEDDGMAIRIPVTAEDRSQGFTRIIVVGIRTTSAATGQRLLEALIDSHHYSTGLSFLKYGTPTNNTQQAQSGHSETVEDHEGSYEVEIRGPAPWNAPLDEPRTNAQRLERALGLGPTPEVLRRLEEGYSWEQIRALGLEPTPEVLRHIAYSEDTEDAFATEMHTALWPATGDYFLRYLLPGLVDGDDLKKLGDHFVRFVRGCGPLPAIRVGDQPYGILPVTAVRAKSKDNPLGWAPSPFDNPSNSHWVKFDIKLHRVLEGLYDKWLHWALNPQRVPRVNPTDATDDLDAELLQILAMEPISTSYRTRPFVDERFVAWMLAALRDYVFGRETPYHELNPSPLYWIQKWAEIWYGQRHQQAQLWNSLTEASIAKFENAPLLRLLGWSNDRNLELDLVRRVAKPDQEVGEDPLQYLRNLCGKTALESQPQTLLHDLLERSLRLADKSCFSADAVRDAICRMATSTLLEFFNTVTEPEQIVRRIKDDPELSVGPPRAYGVRRSLAQRILERRNQLGRFTSIDEIDKIFGVGEDTLHDILYTFRDQELKPDLDLLFRETLDLCTHRLDAWITSLATKRLEAMRQAQPTGIYLGAYGWVENLQKEAGPESEGYIHAPSSAHAKLAAVSHNGYLTYSDGNHTNPFCIDLSSDRVPRALQINKGNRQGQPLGALLGYQFEYGLHEKRLDHYKDDFRVAFPIVANKETPSNEGDSVEAIAARNVVDGLALVRWWRDKNRAPILELDAALSEKGVHEGLDRLLDSLDADSDLKMCEGVYQAVQGNPERGGAALEAASGNAYPPEIESVLTPVSGKNLGHRVCLLFNPSHDVATGQQTTNGDVVTGHRAIAEPRLAKWFSDLVGDRSKIGCTYMFRSERFNINEDTAEELAILPGLGQETAQSIVRHREKNGSFNTVDKLKAVAGIDHATIERLRPWVMTGTESKEKERYYARININTASTDELMTLPDLGPKKAAAIVANRPYKRIADLDLSGIGPNTIEALRRFVTTGVSFLSLGELGISAIDLLYLSFTPPVGEETEIEQRLAYFARAKHGLEYGLKYDTRVDIDFSRVRKFTFSIGEALELSRQVIDLLGTDALLHPGSLCLPENADTAAYTSDDVSDFRSRVSNAKTEVDRVIQLLNRTISDGTGNISTPSQIIEALFDASQFGVSGAVPAAPDDPALETRRQNTLAELQKRVREYEKLLEEVKTADPNRQISLLVEAMKALFGRGFVVLPTFVPPREDERPRMGEPLRLDDITKAFGQTNLLAGLGEERVRLWLQQAAQAHPPLRQLEDAFIMTEVWRQASSRANEPALTLHVAQLPYDEANRWLALDDNERGSSLHANITTGRGVLSIVAAVAGARPALVRNSGPGDNEAGDDRARRIAGLLIEQWDEKIPSNIVDTSVSFHYNGPNSQAPQCLLLAVPSQRSSTPRPWEVEDLAEIVKDTMDLAKVRAVDLDAMREIEGDTPGEPGVGLVFPGLMLPTDPANPSWARKAFMESIEEWVGALVEPEQCATFSDYPPGSVFEGVHETKGFKFRSMGGNQLLLGGYVQNDGQGIVKVLYGQGDILIVLPHESHSILLRAGWISSPQAQRLSYFDNAGQLFDASVDTTTIQGVGFMPNPETPSIIDAQLMVVAIAAPSMLALRIAGDSAMKFVEAVCILS